MIYDAGAEVSLFSVNLDNRVYAGAAGESSITAK